MRARTELAVAAAALCGIALLAFSAGRRGAPTLVDTSASSLSRGPNGLRAFAELAEGAGVQVERSRRRYATLASREPGNTTYIVAQPAALFDSASIEQVLALAGKGSVLVVAGHSARVVFSCAGLSTRVRVFDSVVVVGPSGPSRTKVTYSFSNDPTLPRDGTASAGPLCAALRTARRRTVLTGIDGDAVALRVERHEGRAAIWLLADAALLGTRVLRDPELPGVLMAPLLRGGTTMVFDEFQRVGGGKSMGGAALAWSLSSPWGWAVWQLGLVGLLAYFAGAARFGPVRSLGDRQRRSPLEHVNALANALSAAKGHEVAIGALIKGLRRRLAARSGEFAKAPRAAEGTRWREWFARFALSATGEVRAPAERLQSLLSGTQPDAAVQMAANSVEDVWDALHR